jgi:hypothetical protein
MNHDYRALVCITTCNRLNYLRRYLPHFARFCVDDQRFTLVVAVDGTEPETLRFCDEMAIPVVYSDKREGVGISKNRALLTFPDFDYYFFLEDDVELWDGSVFPAHVELAQASSVHHFSLFERNGLRRPTGDSLVEGRRIRHGLYGGADFNFYTSTGLQTVGGWHPIFAQYRRWGHTEHSYRVSRAGLAPAPFNVALHLLDTCIWHTPETVTRVDSVTVDEDQIAAPEREVMDQELTYVPVQTLSAVHRNGAPLAPPQRLAATLEAGERYPLATGAERRKCRSDYHVWRFETAAGQGRRAAALAAAALNWPTNPALKHAVKMALKT